MALSGCRTGSRAPRQAEIAKAFGSWAERTLAGRSFLGGRRLQARPEPRPEGRRHQEERRRVNAARASHSAGCRDVGAKVAKAKEQAPGLKVAIPDTDQKIRGGARTPGRRGPQSGQVRGKTQLGNRLQGEPLEKRED